MRTFNIPIVYPLVLLVLLSLLARVTKKRIGGGWFWVCVVILVAAATWLCITFHVEAIIHVVINGKK